MNKEIVYITSIMSRGRGIATLTAIVVCAACVAICSPQTTSLKSETGIHTEGTLPATAPALAVPSHILTLEKAGSLTAVEQGDFIEIRLEEQAPHVGRWQLSSQTGDARIEALGEPLLVQDETTTKRVFRFRAVRVGRLEVTFVFHVLPQAPGSQHAVTFTLVIR